MKKTNIFLLLSVLLSTVGFAQSGTYVFPNACMTGANGSNVVMSFSGVASPAGDGTLTVYYQGDFDGTGGNLENASIFDENGTLVGATSPTTQCNANIDSSTFIIPVADLATFAADGIINFDFTPTANVNNTLCNPCGQVGMKLVYPPVTGPDDIGANSIGIGSGAVFCSGSQAVTTVISNAGTNQVTSAIVNWEINGVLQTPVSFAGLLDTLGGTGSQSAVINLGSVTFNPGTTTIRAYTSMPNGVADTSNLNDTTSRSAGPSLSGVFTVDANNPTLGTNFNTFADLSAALNSFGVCGPVTVNVAPDKYNANVIFGNITGASSVNTITIDGGNKSNTSVDGTGGFYTFAFNGSKYVTITNMTILNDNATTMAVLLGANAEYNTVSDCEIKVLPHATSSNVNPIGTSNSLTTRSTNSVGNYNTISDNRIVGGYYGVYFYGGNGNLQTGNKIYNNQIDSAYYYGVYGYYQDEMEVVGNTMDLSISSQINADGIYGLYNTNGIFTENYVHAPDYGFYISNQSTLAGPTTRRTKIINNMVISDADWGMYLLAVDSLDLLHNTIVANGPTNPALQIGSTSTYPISGYDVRNNIFYSVNTEAFEISTTTDSIMIKFDNNIFNTDNGANLIRITTTDYTDLAAYQLAQPSYNSSSLEGDPSFFSNSDLHLAGILANDAGDNSVNILTDIDGDARPISGATIVDIGADEFNPPLCPPPSSLTSYGYTSTSAIISWSGGLGTFEYEVVAGGSGQGSAGSISAVTAVDTALITGLSPYSIYDYYVREICGRGDSSPWIGPVSFRTLCAPFSAPYYNGFETDATDANAGCWSDYFTYAASATAANVWVRAFTGVNGPYAGNQALYIYPQSGFTPGADTIAAISPTFSDMTAGDKQVRFHASVDDVVVQLIVGTSDGLSSFTPLDTISFAAVDVYQEVIVPITTLNGYNGTDQYVVLAHSLPSTLANFDYIRIDEFNYEVMPACPKPLGLGIANLSSSSVDLIWNSPSGGTSFEVEWDLAGFAQGTGNTASITGPIYSLTGLASSTGYDFYVREFCSATDTSIWSGPFTFRTTIQGPTGVNCITGNASSLITEEFNSLATWTGNIGAGTTLNSWNSFTNRTGSTGTGPNGPHSGTNYIYVETSGTTAGTVVSIVSSAFDLTQVSDSAELSFWMHAYGLNIGTLNVNIGTSATGPFTNEFSWSGQLQTAETDPFQNVGVRLDAYTGQTIFVELEYITGASFTSDMAIDLLEINGCISCAAPGSLVDSNLTAFTTDLAWMQNGTVQSWELEYGPSGFTQGTGTFMAVSSLPVSITGLMPATNYDWYVRTICAPGDTSIWVSSFFKTPCAPFTASYYNGFETGTTDVTPDCWTEFKTYTGALANVWTRNFAGVNGPYLGTQAMYIYPQSGFVAGSDTLAAISPEFTDLPVGDKRIRFWASADDVINNELIVGTTDGLGSFTAIDTLTFIANDVYQEFTVDFTAASGYNGTDLHVYLAHGLSSTLANFDYIRVDEFRYEVIPSCVRPSNLSSSNATLNSVDVNWTENNSATNWEISHGTPGFTAGTGTQAVVTAKPHTISGLNPSTSYEFYVRSICTPGSDTSFWEGPLLIATANGIPYLQDFETFAPGFMSLGQAGWISTSQANPRWEAEDASGVNENSLATGPFYDFTNYGVAGGHYVYLETSGGVAGDDDTLSSPPILIPNNGSFLDFTFQYFMYGATMGSVEVYLDTNGTLIPMDTITGQQQTAGGDLWRGDTLAIPGGLAGKSVQIKFVGIRGGSYTGDVSIDDVRIDFSTSVGNIIESVNGLSIFPNPSNGIFNLAIDNNLNETFNLIVFDLSGKKVFVDQVNMNTNTRKQVDLSKLSKGVYFLEVQSGDKSSTEKLIIK